MVYSWTRHIHYPRIDPHSKTGNIRQNVFIYPVFFVITQVVPVSNCLPCQVHIRLDP